MLSILLATSALANEPTCEQSVEMESWRWQITAAEDLLSGKNLKGGQATAESAKDRAPCLSEIPSPEDITRLARIKAVSAFYEQDTDQLEQWAALAAATAPETAWPSWLDGEHPARQLMDQVPPTGWSGWPDRGVAVPRRGGAFLNGRWLDVPLFPMSAPNLIQIFDAGGHRLDAWWQHGAAAPAKLIGAEPTVNKRPRFHRDAESIADIAG